MGNSSLVNYTAEKGACRFDLTNSVRKGERGRATRAFERGPHEVNALVPLAGDAKERAALRNFNRRNDKSGPLHRNNYIPDDASRAENGRDTARSRCAVCQKAFGVVQPYARCDTEERSISRRRNTSGESTGCDKIKPRPCDRGISSIVLVEAPNV